MSSTPDPDNALILGPFELLEPIGAGGTATVWRGIHRAQRVPVAVKVMEVRTEPNSRFRADFQNEVRAMAGLQHPNIVHLFDAGEVDAQTAARSGGRMAAGSPYLAMELADGGSLSGDREPLAWLELKRVLLAILEALAYAHSRGVIHLDLKPANVLLVKQADERPVHKLTDFGLSFIVRHSARTATLQRQVSTLDLRERTGVIAGTPLYMAPEQFDAAHRDYGPWTDLYGLGCLAFRLATGAPPFDYENIVRLSLAHLQSPPPPVLALHRMPEGFNAWVHRLMAKRPEDRFQRAADAIQALLELADPWDGDDEHPSIERTIEATLTGRAAEELEDDTPTLRGDTVRWQVSGEQVASSPQTTSVTVRTPRRGPPLPVHWEGAQTPALSTRLAGAGLGLFSLRPLPIVGRSAERSALWAALRRVHQVSKAQLALLHGPGGTGKSRLAEWLAERAHEVGGATILKAVHGPHGAAGDGLPRMVARHLRCLSLTPADALERTGTLLRALGETDPHEWEVLAEIMTPVLEPESARPGKPSAERPPPPRDRLPIDSSRRHVVVRRLLERLARERPLIVWMEDVQWGSDALAFAEHVLRAQSLTPAPILLLLTLQEEALAERPLEAAQLDDLMLLGATQRIPVPPMPAADYWTLVRETLGLEEELARRVVKRASGNPLFAVQLVGDWVQRGVLRPGPGGFVLAPGEAMELPDSLHEVWAARIQRLLEAHPPEARQALELAAVLGREVDTGDWQAACGLAGIRIPAGLLEVLRGARLVQLGEWRSNDLELPRGWSFVHGMFHESLERLAREAGRWEAHHRTCATVLQQRYPADAARMAERVASHLLAARAFEPALEPLLKAAERYLATGDLRQAHALLQQRETAMKILELPEQDPRWGETWLARAAVFVFQGKLDAALLSAREAQFAAQRNDWTQVLPGALRQLAVIAEKRGDPAEAARLGRQALAGYQQNGDRAGAANCLRGLADSVREMGDARGAGILLQKAITLYHQVKDAKGEADCLLALGSVSRALGDAARAAAFASKGLLLYERIGSLSGRADALRLLGVLAMDERNLEQAADRFGHALNLCQQLGSMFGVANGLNDIAEIDRLRGDDTAAAEGYRRSIQIHEAVGSGQGIFPRCNLALLYLKHRNFIEAQRTLEPCRRDLLYSERTFALRTVHTYLLPCAAAARDWSTWDECLHYVLSLTRVHRVDPDDAWPIELAGELALEAGDLSRARDAFQLAIGLWRDLNRSGDASRLEARLQAPPLC